jgi:hypothetical protein
MKKRDPLSTPETMGTPASPRQKPWKGRCPTHGCSGGLVGGAWASFTVPEMDTFIEKPFSKPSPPVCAGVSPSRGGLTQMDFPEVRPAGFVRARVVGPEKPALGQLISFSVGSEL